MTSSSSTKTFILDTNVILHDSACINNFQEHDIVIPITVLEELDQFKKGNQTLNYHAREFVRALDTLSAGKLLNGGVRERSGTRGGFPSSSNRCCMRICASIFPQLPNRTTRSSTLGITWPAPTSPALASW